MATILRAAIPLTLLAANLLVATWLARTISHIVVSALRWHWSLALVATVLLAPAAYAQRSAYSVHWTQIRVPRVTLTPVLVGPFSPWTGPQSPPVTYRWTRKRSSIDFVQPIHADAYGRNLDRIERAAAQRQAETERQAGRWRAAATDRERIRSALGLP